MSELSFMSFPFQLSVYSPNDFVTKRNCEGFSAGKPVCYVTSPNISVDSGKKTREVWWTDASLLSFLSKACFQNLQKPPLTSDIHSVRWELVTWVLLKNAALWLCYREVGMSSVQMWVQSKGQDNIGITQHETDPNRVHRKEMRGLMSVRCHIFVRGLVQGSDNLTSSQCNMNVIIQRYCYYIHLSSNWLAVHWYLALCKHLKVLLLTSSCTKASNTITVYCIKHV